jgi:hypothetical protein
MTEAELWHMHLLAVENTSSALQGVMTIIFAYLATAYFAGHRLTRLQAAFVSVFFVCGAAVASFMALVEFRRAAFFMDRLAGQFGIESISPNSLVIPFFAGVMAIFIPASVLFMYQRRRTNQPGAQEESSP